MVPKACLMHKWLSLLSGAFVYAAWVWVIFFGGGSHSVMYDARIVEFSVWWVCVCLRRVCVCLTRVCDFRGRRNHDVMREALMAQFAMNCVCVCARVCARMCACAHVRVCVCVRVHVCGREGGSVCRNCSVLQRITLCCILRRNCNLDRKRTSRIFSLIRT